MTTAPRPERFPKRARLEQLIIGRLAETKAHTLPGVCLRYGLEDGDQGEAYDGKAIYIGKRLAKLQTAELIRVAREVGSDLNDEEILVAVTEASSSGTSPDLLAHDLTPALVREDWAKARNRLEADWPGAVTMAATTLDSALKHVLDATDSEHKKFDNMPVLFDRAVVALETPEWTDGFRHFLRSLREVVEKLGRVRGGYSDAHGTGPDRPIVDAQQAELAVNVAGSLALFLVQTSRSKSG